MTSVAFVTTHGAVLACIAASPGARLWEIAACAGITDRAVSMTVRDLIAGGYVTVSRDGRRNRYHVHAEVPIGDRGFRDLPAGALLGVLVPCRLRTPAVAAPGVSSRPEPPVGRRPD